MATRGRRPGRPTQAETERLGEQLREAALSTFLENGYDRTSMEAIARAAGITKQTLYSRYPDKRAVFADVIPWAMSRHEPVENVTPIDGDDLRESLTQIARTALARTTDPQMVRMQRIAMNEASRFPEFEISAETMRWSARHRAVTQVLQRHLDAGDIEIEDGELELAAEHFLALVEALPARLAEFGIFRSTKQSERHLQYAVKIFLRAMAPVRQGTTKPRSRRRQMS
jgi:TetR/AcrR family transcriptional regulator, mexJK operon transcriptional repressor